MFLKKANCASSTINQSGGLNSSDLTVIISDVSSFPTSGDFLSTMWNESTFPDPCDDPKAEIVKVTGVSGNTFTIERGQEDTTGKAHANGQTIAMLITAGTFEELQNAINALSPGEQVDSEELSSQVDGLTNSFTTSFNYVAGTLKIYVGGFRQTPGVGKDYTETGVNSFDLNYIPEVGERILVDYTKS